ncbi:unnamed protein product [Ixodes persulcatus]
MAKVVKTHLEDSRINELAWPLNGADMNIGHPKSLFRTLWNAKSTEWSGLQGVGIGNLVSALSESINRSVPSKTIINLPLQFSFFSFHPIVLRM